MNGLEHLESDYERAKFLQDTLIAFATNDQCGGTSEDYSQLRQYFMDNPTTKALLPTWVRVSRDTGQFWHFIKHKLSTYAERREFIWAEFEPLLEHCEHSARSPADTNIGATLQEFDETSIHAAWHKALERRAVDPEGAITAARSLLESVCKHILEERHVSYEGKAPDLPALYKATANELNLSPSQHSEEVFRRILGGCTSVVEGLGAIRNRLGDSHGQGRNPVKPAPRHAELAVNLAGTVAVFLIDTFRARNEELVTETRMVSAQRKTRK